MIRGGALFIWGWEVKNQGQLWYSTYETFAMIQTTGFALSLPNFSSFKLIERRIPIDFESQVQRSRST